MRSGLSSAIDSTLFLQLSLIFAGKVGDNSLKVDNALDILNFTSYAAFQVIPDRVFGCVVELTFLFRLYSYYSLA